MEPYVKLSICIITYNHEKFIEQAINGVLMQKCNFDFELIISNDCSTDNTDTIIKTLLKNHKKKNKIKYFKHNKNIGVLPNFNFALKKCNGKYIALCDGDDYWTDINKLQTQIDFLESNSDYVACFHNAKVINQKNEKYSYHKWSINKDISHEDIIMNGGGIFPTAALVYKNLIKNDSFLINTHSGDSIIAFSLVNLGKIRFLKEFMSVYRKHDNGVYTSLATNPKKILEKDIIGNIKMLTSFRYKAEIKNKKYYNNAIQKQLQRIVNRFGIKMILILTLKGKIKLKDCFLYLKCKI